MGEFALLLFLGVAQLERKQISARTKEKAEWRAQKGLKNGGQILGYDIDPDNPGVPTVNETEKQLGLWKPRWVSRTVGRSWAMT